MTTTALVPRQRLLLSLCDDLNAQGWNQKHKLWFVKGEINDEWLHFAHEFSGAPEMHMLDLIAEQQLPEDAHGVLVVTEGWTYPRRLLDTFTDAAAYQSYVRITPPDEHPERVELRHLLLVCNDGEVWALTYTNQTSTPEQSWAAIDINTPSPVGDRTVDAARGLLGLNDGLVERLHQVDALELLGTISQAVEQAMSGDYTEEETTRNLFMALPEPMRHRLVKEMPDDIKDIVRRSLTEEEQRKYGL